MKERPILFNSVMVKAILDGRKTQTRRIIKDPFKIKYRSYNAIALVTSLMWNGIDSKEKMKKRADKSFDKIPEKIVVGTKWGELIKCPYGIPGDRLYLKEGYKFSLHGGGDIMARYKFPYKNDSLARLFNRANIDKKSWAKLIKLKEDKWYSKLFMFKFTARIKLELTDVRVERIQDISTGDILHEGTPQGKSKTTDPWEKIYDDFQEFWDSINLKRGYGWEKNPWCWVISFKRIK